MVGAATEKELLNIVKEKSQETVRRFAIDQ
jgi:hypothetical protein